MSAESIHLPINHVESESGFIEKHTRWVSETKEKIAKNWRSFSLRTLVTISSIVFVQQEVNHIDTGGKYDYKSALGYGLFLKSKEKTGLDALSSELYENEIME